MPRAPKTRMGMRTPARRRTIPSSMSAQASMAAPARSRARPTSPAPWPYAFALTTAMTPGDRGSWFVVRGSDRSAEMRRRLLSIAARSTRATVGRIMAGCGESSRNDPRRSRRPLGEVLEARVFLDERELDGADRTVALLADDDLGGALGFLVPLPVGIAVLLFAEDEHDHVGVLFERAGLAQVRQLRAVVGAGLRRTRQLRQRDDRDLQLLGQSLQRSRDRGELGLAAFEP